MFMCVFHTLCGRPSSCVSACVCVCAQTIGLLLLNLRTLLCFFLASLERQQQRGVHPRLFVFGLSAGTCVCVISQEKHFTTRNASLTEYICMIRLDSPIPRFRAIDRLIELKNVRVCTFQAEGGNVRKRHSLTSSAQLPVQDSCPRTHYPICGLMPVRRTSAKSVGLSARARTRPRELRGM